ncbi:MAG: Hydrogenase maturation factor HybF [Phycisphaerae bacterium]|nr:Hydrogenase maturation factor HybF [Phycisphaerae bacterium]
MHELYLAQELLNQVLQSVSDHPDAKVCAVEIEVGPMKQIVLEAMELAWRSVVEGSLADQSVLHQVEVPITAQCRNCTRTFEAAIDSYQCPECRQADVQIMKGHEIILKSITLEEIKAGEREQGASH